MSLLVTGSNGFSGNYVCDALSEKKIVYDTIGRECANNVVFDFEIEIRNVYSVRPGITGLAQIYKVDMSTLIELAELDAKMINEYSLFDYFKYIFSTFFGKGFGDRILHNKIDILE